MKRIIFAALTAGVLALVGCSTGISQDAAEQACHEDTIGYAKYPGAATIAKTDFYVDEEGAAQVSGLADFPNGFGTPVRHTYICTATVNEDGDTVVEENIVLEGEFLDQEFFDRERE